jgi:predicted alpha/beta superfamily hydrolase
LKKKVAKKIDVVLSKQLLLTTLLFLLLFNSNAQFTVQFVIEKQPLDHQDEPLFLAGNINNWQPNDGFFQFKKQSERQLLVLKNTPPQQIEYKITGGSWQKVECGPNNQPIANRVFQINGDTIIYITISNWNIDVEKKHTQSKNVLMLPINLFNDSIFSNRKIWVYLPTNYAVNKKNYPVMYVQDGQNMFDNYTSAYGEWGIDEYLDSAIEKGAPACIVVAIESSQNRLTEYNPFYNEKFGNGFGDAYIQSIINILKPYIDMHFNTIPNKENTIIAGSSMGALISFYATIKYPAFFGKGGFFSPAFWIAKNLDSLVNSNQSTINGKYFFSIGDLEGEEYINDLKRLQELVAKNTNCMIFSSIIVDANHNEANWRSTFPAFYTWIMAAGSNVITNKDD